MEVDLWGNPIEERELLRDKFIEVPFSTLNARSGHWQARKQKWLRLGIKSEIGRDAKCMAQDLNKYDYRESYTGKSVFDSALCELMYSWFTPPTEPFSTHSQAEVFAALSPII